MAGFHPYDLLIQNEMLPANEAVKYGPVGCPSTIALPTHPPCVHAATVSLVDSPPFGLILIYVINEFVPATAKAALPLAGR